MQLKPHSSLTSLVEYLKMLNNYRVMSTKTRLITTASAILIVAVLVIVGAVTKAQTSQTNAQVVILNLLNGQQYFGVPHVYQGDYNGKPTNQWPVYLGPNNASQYWSLAGISSNQPVLELAVPSGWTSGAMFWSETYSGGVVKITFIGTFSNGPSPVADGYEIYLFLTPTTWGVSPKYNYSIPYNSVAGEGWLTYAPPYPSPVGGDVIFPQSSTPYIMVQWDPWWQFGYSTSGATGQWNVYIMSNPSGNNPSVSPSPSPNLGWPYAGWDGIGTGAFQPNPGDRINITVTYNPNTNTLSGVATDLNTGQSASFTLYLANYFTPPSSGNYVFGVGAATRSGWALLYVAMTTSIKPSPSTTSTTTPATVTVTTTTTVTSTVTSLVTTTVTSPVTTTVISTVTSPITTTVASTTTTFTVTTTSPVTVTTTVFTTSSIIQTMIIALIIIIVVLAAALVTVTIRRR
jgi:hypothetical protein